MPRMINFSDVSGIIHRRELAEANDLRLEIAELICVALARFSEASMYRKKNILAQYVSDGSEGAIISTGCVEAAIEFKHIYVPDIYGSGIWGDPARDAQWVVEKQQEALKIAQQVCLELAQWRHHPMMKNGAGVLVWVDYDRNLGLETLDVKRACDFLGIDIPYDWESQMIIDHTRNPDNSI